MEDCLIRALYKRVKLYLVWRDPAPFSLFTYFGGIEFSRRISMTRARKQSLLWQKVERRDLWKIARRLSPVSIRDVTPVSRMSLKRTNDTSDVSSIISFLFFVPSRVQLIRVRTAVQ